jgi:PAS domain S-box-containing protein
MGESVFIAATGIVVAAVCLMAWLTTSRRLSAAQTALSSMSQKLIETELRRGQAEQKLHDWLQLYEWAEEAASLGIWEWDPKDGGFALSKGAAAIAGFPGGACRVTQAELSAAIHPDDVEGIKAAQRSAFKQEGKTTYDVEYRRLRPDGSIRWYRNRSSTEFKGGAPTRVVGTVLDITDHQELLLRLEGAKQAAEAALRAKSQFLANMSHEIRTPMNAVMGMTSLLLDFDLADDAKDYLKVIRNSSDSLLTIINDILDFSKIESGKLDLEHVPIDLHECLEEAAELLAPKCAEKHLEIAVDIDPALAEWVYGDSTRLRQIVVNLIGNAVKFTEKGEVVIQAHKTLGPRGETQIHIAVKDTGIGIAAHKLDRLFQSFSQVDDTTTRKFGGTGLGLAISRRLTEMMKGRMWVESCPGVGSTFQFSIPYEPAPAQKFPPAAAKDWMGKRVLIVDDNATNRHIVSEYVRQWGFVSKAVAAASEALIELRSTRYDILLLDWHMPEMDGTEFALAVKTEFGSAAPPMVMLSSSAASAREAFRDRENPFAAMLTKPVRRQQLHCVLLRVLTGLTEQTGVTIRSQNTLAERAPLRILLADDNLVNQKVGCRLLERWGYRPNLASNGLEVLAALRRQPYDVVLLDVQMPEMDGLETAKRIRAEWGSGRRPLLIALTAGAMKEDRLKCLASGMDGYLSKPINVKELEATLDKCHADLSARSALLLLSRQFDQLALEPQAS